MSASVAGEWLYTHQSTDLLKSIQHSGWKPECNKGTKYGCAVYLSREPWYNDALEALVCEVDLSDAEVMVVFPAAKGWEAQGDGNSYKHFGRYLQSEGVIAGNHPPAERGDSSQNIAIRDHFRSKGIKAVRINEHDHDVLIVYDTAAIRIVERRQLSGSQGESTT